MHVNCYILFLFFLQHASAKIHHLNLPDDRRRTITLSSFSYLQQGYLKVQVINMTLSKRIQPTDDKELVSRDGAHNFGLTLSRGSEISEFTQSHPGECALDSKHRRNAKHDVVYFSLDLANSSFSIERQGQSIQNLSVCHKLPCASPGTLKNVRAKRKTAFENLADEAFPDDQNDKETEKILKTVPTNENDKNDTDSDLKPTSPSILVKKLKMTAIENVYSFQFVVVFWDKQEEGLYTLIFHNCYNQHQKKYDYNNRVGLSFSINIVERNEKSFLSAGDIPKPRLFFALAGVFFVTGLIWLHMMRTRKENEVYRVHYLMLFLVILKCLSLFSHGINYYFISIYGHQREVWAVVYYVMHLLKGALLFGTIILIGTGYTFFKNFLTERDRKLFIVVIPLQVLNNIALIILEEKEQGEKNYRFWTQMFILIDLVCCVAIILPVLWSIRHLQEASRTDGKAAFNLEKLQLFRHFYIIVICYIYITRILKYLILFTVPYRYSWLDVVVIELATWFFFVVTGYKFKPAPNNPYLRLSQSDEDLEMDDVLTPSGALESVSRVKRITVAVSDDESPPETPKSKTDRSALTADGAGPEIF